MADRRTVLFDFDGTIAETVEAGVAAFNELARRYGFLEITSENGPALRAGGPRAAMKTLGVPMFRVPLVLRALRKGVKLALPSIAPVAGIPFAMRSLREKGCRLGIVTSASRENVLGFLRNNRMSEVDYMQAGVSVFGKVSAIRKLIAHEGLGSAGRGGNVIFVSDEIRDIEAAKKNGLTTVAVTWGLNSREGLARAGADHVVDTPRELLALLGGTSRTSGMVLRESGHARTIKPTIPIRAQ